MPNDKPEPAETSEPPVTAGRPGCEEGTTCHDRTGTGNHPSPR
ncbi:hypothetical protein LV78_006574 [Actinosynnema pretiosum]|nr:hypothetical protein [Actinosynnema pretiosum]MCP2098577.1 hypothetical protein [Actinosynnema pretiosum]